MLGLVLTVWNNPSQCGTWKYKRERDGERNESLREHRLFLIFISSTSFDNFLGSLSICVFETRTATGKKHFVCRDSGVFQIFIPIISDGEKIFSNANEVVWRRVRRENSSLPVAICVSKIRLLTLPIYILARMTSIGLCWCTKVSFFAVFFILGANVECASQCPQFTTAFVVEKSGKFGRKR